MYRHRLTSISSTRSTSFYHKEDEVKVGNTCTYIYIIHIPCMFNSQFSHEALQYMNLDEILFFTLWFIVLISSKYSLTNVILVILWFVFEAKIYWYLFLGCAGIGKVRTMSVMLKFSCCGHTTCV